MNSTKPTCSPSAIELKPKLKGVEAMADSMAARLGRLALLRVRYPRLEKVCRPQRENFWVIGGRPGSFKTAFLWNLALNLAEERKRVLFVSLEMTDAEMALLALAKFSGLSRSRIQARFGPDQIRFGGDESPRWDAALIKLSGLEMNLRLHDAEAHGRSIRQIIDSATRSRFDAVFVDHLGMIGRDTPGRELEVLADAVHRLRGLSKGEVVADYRPWVVCTSQLNREIDKSEDGERVPRLADFRGSSRIEHDADVAIALQKRKGAEDGPSTLDAFVLKNRNGVCPECLCFDAHGPTGLISERRKDHDAAPAPHWQDEEAAE